MITQKSAKIKALPAIYHKELPVCTYIKQDGTSIEMLLKFSVLLNADFVGLID